MPNSKTILVAEDDKFLSKVYQVKLKKEGYEIVSAIDGEDALKKIYSEKPAIILLDIIMPKKTGLDVLVAIKKDPSVSNIPVIILTNLGQEEDKEKAMKDGAVDYIVKANTTIEEVVGKVEKHINGQPAVAPSQSVPAAQSAGMPTPEQTESTPAEQPTAPQTESAEPTPPSAVCAQCKKQVPQGSAFCPSCGTKID